MMLSRWQSVLTPTPHLHPLPLTKGRGERRGDKAKVTIAEATSRPRHGELAMIAPHQEDFLFSRLPDSFGVRSHVRYCTVTSVPTGISEKNLRAVSSGNRMQPCDAG